MGKRWKDTGEWHVTGRVKSERESRFTANYFFSLLTYHPNYQTQAGGAIFIENHMIVWSDWDYYGQFPWNEILRSQEMLSEAMLFEKQERLKIEANQRRAKFEEMIDDMRIKFEMDEYERRKVASLLCYISAGWVRYITSCRTVPLTYQARASLANG